MKYKGIPMEINFTTKYISKDGFVFSTQDECLSHEKNLYKGDLYVVLKDDHKFFAVDIGPAGSIFKARYCHWSPNCYMLEGIPSPYDKDSFRLATIKEIKENYEF